MKTLRTFALIILTLLGARGSAQSFNVFGSLLINQSGPVVNGRYFMVQSAGTWNGNLGGLSGANAKCLTDLTANDWKGKATVTTLNSTTVKAFLCDGTTCQNPQANTGYIFAKAGDTTAGGASLYSDSSSQGPTIDWFGEMDGSTWAVPYAFNSTNGYWTGRDPGTATAWANTGNASRCTNWTSSSGAVQGMFGYPSYYLFGTVGLWSSMGYPCSSALYLLCMVTQSGSSDTPSGVSFTDVTGAYPGTIYTTSSTVTGFSGTLNAAIMADYGDSREVRKNNTGTWGPNVSLTSGDTLNVRTTGSYVENGVKIIPITIGRSKTTWTVTSGDYTPDPFSFADVGNATPSTVYEVSAVLTGFDSPTPGSVAGGSAQIRANGTGAWVTSMNFNDGDTVNLRMTSAAAADGGKVTVFTLGTANVGWYITNSRPNFLVRTSTNSYDGNLGGMSGADALCLTDLTNNNFQGKAGVTLNSTTVKAFLCDSTACRNLNSNATYHFARSGDVSIGGESFTTNTMAIGPNNASYWNTTTTFGESGDLWTGRVQQDANNWSSTPGATCNNWTANGSFDSGTFGYADYNDASRFNVSNLFACPTTRYLLCSVTSTPIDSQPDAFSFTSTEGATPSTVYETSAVVSGFTAGLTFSATAGAEVRVNSTGSWATSVAVNPGDTLNLRMTSPATVGGAITTTVTAGMRSPTWTVMNLRPYTLVLTKSTWNGNLGGLAGANAKCLTDLTTYNYQGKTGITLNASTVKALMCDTTTCQNPNASTTYYYAVADSLADGGGTTAINASSQGPGDAVAWTNAARFGSTQAAIWSGRNTGAASLWSTTPGGIANCTDWTSPSSGVNGRRGALGNTNATRWSSTDIACNLTRPIVCIVTSP